MNVTRTISDSANGICQYFTSPFYSPYLFRCAPLTIARIQALVDTIAILVKFDLPIEIIALLPLPTDHDLPNSRPRTHSQIHKYLNFSVYRCSNFSYRFIGNTDKITEQWFRYLLEGRATWTFP